MRTTFQFLQLENTRLQDIVNNLNKIIEDLQNQLIELQRKIQKYEAIMGNGYC